MITIILNILFCFRLAESKNKYKAMTLYNFFIYINVNLPLGMIIFSQKIQIFWVNPKYYLNILYKKNNAIL